MNILFLTQVIPYPPDAGPKIKTWHVLNYLASQGHQVTLASFSRVGDEAALPALRQVCHAVYSVPIRRSRFKDGIYFLRSLISGRPFLIERDDLSEMRSLVRRLLETGMVDCIHTDQLPMTQFALSPGARPGRVSSATGLPMRVFDAHNATWKIVEQMGRNAPWFLKPAAMIEMRRVERYEGMIMRNFDHTLAVSEIDRIDLLHAVETYDRKASHSNHPAAPAISVFPITIDTNQIKPSGRIQGSMQILTLGTLHYPPNADGIRWFARSVFPIVKEHIPDASLTIVGKNPPADFVELAAKPGSRITVTGYVPDLNPYFQQSAVLVVPVRAGSGVRVRIIEGFAQAMPVVTTSVGLEGILARDGEEVLVADTPEAFAESVIRVLKDPALQARLASNGRSYAEKCFDWRSALKGLDQIYKRAQDSAH